MAETTTETHISALTRLGYAISDQTRATIMLELRSGPAFPSELADRLGVSRQVMSNQLACLRGCGLVEGLKQGRQTSYRLADEHLAPALGDLMRLTLTVDPTCCSSQGCTCA